MKPTHYADPNGDLIDIMYKACPMAAMFFCAVNSIKYHKRLGKKDGASVLDDLDKAQEYHRRLEAMLDGKPISYYMRLANQAYFQDKSDDELEQMCGEMAAMPDEEFEANMAALSDTLKGTNDLPESELASDRHSGSAIEQLFGLAKEPDNELPKGVAVDVKLRGRPARSLKPLPEGVTVDTRIARAPKDKRRLHFGEAIPHKYWEFQNGLWVECTASQRNQELSEFSIYTEGLPPIAVLRDHPITPFKNEA